MNINKVKLNIEELYNTNINYFKSNQQKLYEQILESSEKPSLTIDTNTLTLNKVNDNNIIYKEGAVSSAQAEVTDFINTMNKINYKPSPSSINVKDIIKKNAFIKTAKHYSRYFDKCRQLTPEKGDLIIFGIGLGHHIKILNELGIFDKIIVIENNIKNLKESLYCTNWNKLLNENKNISIIVKSNSNTEEFDNELTDILNKSYPSILVSTLIYNHLENTTSAIEYSEIKEKINNYCVFRQVAIECSGPDSQRLLNSNYNISRCNKILNLDKTTIGNNNSNIIIVGAGPSLDDYIDIIKKYRNNLFVISSGSSLISLLKSNIHPDIHFELEFQNLAALNLEHVNRSFNLKNTTLISSLSCNPKLSDYFKETHYFIQAASEFSSFLPSSSTLDHGGISCTNGAAAFASRISEGTIYLVGLDFAYTNNVHHAKDNISYQKDLKGGLKHLEEKKNEIQGANIKTLDIYDNIIMTTPLLHAAKEVMQNLTSIRKNQFINCSFGSKITNTIHHNPNQLIKKFKASNNLKPKINLVFNDTLGLEINKKTNSLYKESFSVCDTIQKIIKSNLINSNVNFLTLVKSIQDSIESDYSNNNLQYRNIMSFIRLPLLSLFIITNYTDNSYKIDIIKTWLNDYTEYLKHVKITINTYLENNDFPSKEDWIETNK